MSNIAQDLDKIQSRLHDNGVLWTRAELLRYYNDGYEILLHDGQATRRFYLTDMPGRFSHTILYEWERRHTQGTYWRASHLVYDATKAAMYAWEGEQNEGVLTSDGVPGITHQWEWSYAPNDRYYRFALPKDDERIVHVSWNDKVLLPINTRELDDSDTRWWDKPGEPLLWSEGVGHIKTIEIYGIATAYIQNYELKGFERGMPALFSGDRNYQVALDSHLPSFTWAYTSSGDSDAMTRQPTRFTALLGVTQQWEGPYQFTIPDDGYGRTCTQLWEVQAPNQNPVGGTAVGQVLGIWPWEGAYLNAKVPVLADGPIKMEPLGPGLRFTQNAVNGYHGTQIWEKEMQQGLSTFTAGGVIGTYPWEHLFPIDGSASPEYTAALGTIGKITSPDRQYLAVTENGGIHLNLGIISRFASSADALSILHAIIPGVELAEEDYPELLPPQLQKYMRYYVLSRAFAKAGEGQQPLIAKHYNGRFKAGIKLLRRLANIAYKDEVYVRQQVASERRRPPRVRLPGTFEQVLE